jgi:thiol-disulfide isomerase/thioredoxin/Flp pilus assembly protein TadD
MSPRFFRLCPLFLAAMLAGARFSAGQAVSVSSSAAPAIGAPVTAAYESDPKFKDALEQGRVLQKQRNALFACEAYKKASKIAGGQCPDCLQGIYDTQMMQGNFKEAAVAAASLAETESSALSKSRAFSEQGRALVAQGGEKPKPALLEAAHKAFQSAIAVYPKNAAALYLDGQVLAQIGRMEDASAEFKQCLSCSSPGDPAHLRAEHFAENPELSTHKMAPAFVITALDGSKFNLDAMGGRAVLIDFWATWCGPCNEELPHMRKIAKEFAGQPLVIISVSWDADEAKWKQFIQKNEMTWTQYRDADHKLSNSFGINAIPHYFTIDSDGVLTAEMLGSGSDVEGKLKKLIAKAKAAQTVSGASSSTGD